MRVERASTDRSEGFRGSVFNFENAISIGFRSGEIILIGMVFPRRLGGFAGLEYQFGRHDDGMGGSWRKQERT